MKKLTFALVLMLAVAGSAFAQSETSTTLAAVANYPAGTLYNGVPLAGIEAGAGAAFANDGSYADGKVAFALKGVPNPLTGQQIIRVSGTITSGSRTATNASTISGLARVDLGNGAPPLAGVPFVASLTMNTDGTGQVGLILGGVTLPTVSIGDGTLTVESLAD